MIESGRGQRDRVGIILATYNCDRSHFAEQIRSIQQQDFTHWTCLVTDDGSTPEIRQFISEVIGGDRRFIYYAQPQNLGAYHNFEYGIQSFSRDASITHLAFADQDDIWRSDKLRKLLAAFSENEVVLAHSDLALIDDQGKLLHPSVWQYEKRCPEKLDTRLLLLRNTVTGCTVMIDRCLIGDLLPFPKQSIKGGWHHDYWLALVAAQRGKIAHLRDPLVQYRRHAQNAVGTEEAVGTFRHELTAWANKKGELGLKSYRIHRDLSQAFFQRLGPAVEGDRHNPFSDRSINFGLPILRLGWRSLWVGYGVAGVTLRLFAQKVIFDVNKIWHYLHQLWWSRVTK